MSTMAVMSIPNLDVGLPGDKGCGSFEPGF